VGRATDIIPSGAPRGDAREALMSWMRTAAVVGVAAVAAAAAAGAGRAAGPKPAPSARETAFCGDALAAAAAQYQGFLAAYADPTRIPRSAKDGKVRFVDAGDWTSGFPAATLWRLYEHTRDARFRAAAESWTRVLEPQSDRRDTHDVGFVIDNTFGAGHRLTGNAAYAPVVVRAARSLTARFDPEVGATRSWDFGKWAFPVIVDNMMNLELLFHASALTKDPAFARTAVTHALTTRANHVRPDGSSYHVVDYDPATGAVHRRQTNQGIADESTWARGQAWGLYGFTMVYRETKDPRFLETAQRMADFYVGHERMPEDGVPYFDFDAPLNAKVEDHRDASAGAIAASGLLELSGFVKPEAAARYRAFALRALRSLSSPGYCAARGTNAHFLLMHAVGNYPIGDEIDVAINYADYYYVEALLRGSRLP
jgi:rhamnogalacturonyl hydrolase YesR